MTVKELIEELSQFNNEIKIVFHNEEFDDYMVFDKIEIDNSPHVDQIVTIKLKDIQ